MKTEFNELLLELQDTYQKCSVKDKRLYYSLCAVEMQKNTPLILGINWGGEHDQPQSEYPSEEEWNCIKSDNFISRSLPYLNKLRLSLEDKNFNYANLCFFRTKNYRDLKLDDYKLTLPTFKKYVNYIKPPFIVSLSTENFKILKALNESEFILTHTEEIAEYGQKRKFKCTAARLWNIPILFLPHPQAHIDGTIREELWSEAANYIDDLNKKHQFFN